MSIDTETSPPLLGASTSATALTPRPERFAPCLGHALHLLGAKLLVEHDSCPLKDPRPELRGAVAVLGRHCPCKVGESSPCMRSRLANPPSKYQVASLPMLHIVGRLPDTLKRVQCSFRKAAVPGRLRDTILHIYSGESALVFPRDAPARLWRYWLKGMAAHL